MKLRFVLRICIVFLVFHTHGSVILKEKNRSYKRWKNYFSAYGYTTSTKDSREDHNEQRRAYEKVRILFRFDYMTSKKEIDKFFQSPRCGNKDLETHVESRRKRRYQLNPAWRINNFTYAFLKYTSDMTTEQQLTIAAAAFKVWTDVVPELNFTLASVSSSANIIISFEEGNHGDHQAFDGTGPILAHSFYPEDGRIHLDDAEEFKTSCSTNYCLLRILVHEIGHVLGLGHSFVLGSIMNPLYQFVPGEPILHDDDINGMRLLYAPETASPPKCSDIDSLCSYFASEGYCTEYEDVMKITCPYSCNLCDS